MVKFRGFQIPQDFLLLYIYIYLIGDSFYEIITHYFIQPSVQPSFYIHLTFLTEKNTRRSSLKQKIVSSFENYIKWRFQIKWK